MLLASGHSARGALRRSAVRRQPGHVALTAVGEKRLERIARAFDRIGGGEAHGIEAERLGLSGDPLFQRLCSLAHSMLGATVGLKNRDRHRFRTG